MNRTEASRAVAKVLAFLAVGRVPEARWWAQRLIAWLETI